MKHKIRTSTAILGGLVVFLIFLIFSLIISVRYMAEQGESSRKNLLGSNSMALQGENRTITLGSSIDSLLLSGVWECSIRKGPAASAVLTLPDSFDPKRINWEERGDTFILENDWDSNNNRKTPQLILTIPRLKRITGESVSTISFTGFKGDELTVNCSGVADIRGENSSFDKAVIALSGTGNIDLSDVKTINADVQLSGLGSINLYMDGGELSGNLSGLGNIEYSGKADRNNLKVTGLGNVSRSD